MCPEAEQEVRDFIAQAEAVLGAEAQASPASLSALASTAKSLAWRPGLWANTDKAAAKSTIAELLSRPAFKRALLLVTNEATRWTRSPHQRSLEEQQGLKAKIEALEAVVLLCGCLLGSSNPAAPVLDFARRLVLSQTLEALSGRLADARAELEFVADRAAAAAAAVGVGPFLQADAPALLMLLVPTVDLVGAAAHLMRGCLQLAIREPDAGPGPQSAAAAAASGAAPEPSAPAQPAGAAASGSSAPSGAAVAEAAASSACYAQELAAALRASAVAEHTSLARGPSVARGPGAFYTSLAYGVAVLSAMDGEDTYGLEPSVGRGVSALVRMEAGERLRELSGAGGQGPRTYRCDGSLRSLVAFLTWLPLEPGAPTSAAGVTLLSREAALGLALRTARVGVQAAVEAAAGRTEEEEVAAVTAAQEGAGPCRVLLLERAAAEVALHALAAARLLSGGPDNCEDWWRLAVALAPHLGTAYTGVGAQYARDVLRCLPSLLPPPAPLPPAPPLGLESALAGGVLPCLERLFRRTAAGLREGGLSTLPESEALAPFAGCESWPRLAPLLAWGDARQAAALVRTITKGLSVNVNVRGSDGELKECIVLTTACHFLTAGRSWLESLASRGRRPRQTEGPGLAQGGAGALSPAERQLLEMLAAAAAAWLPSVTLQLHLPHLAEACCAVAAALPEEVAGRGGEAPAWQPQQLRSLGAECRARGHAAAAEALAAQLVRWAHGSGPRGGRGGARASAASGAHALAARFGAWFPGLEAAAALLPASPAAARACLGGCSNPACANLEGDSDAALPLRACAGCGGTASYCSRECQTAHWRSGHREACRGGAGGGGGGARRSS
ncbi:hypothetical protein HYH03_017877 [Edaphochlamys debaryana]|uniref:MYND-type domain-containing protein n=1 Tax=Edaphochlamys debaryana TaxID=47281 RepID=A0A836BNP1_9CHLO|nr:hypothetical protein HYH03_017877 [Edaphochlamys debaryana]|eukprot:KAG2483220.1 hypothetical protein HYH03_017877 [Edaphochlamys debaryana]